MPIVGQPAAPRLLSRDSVRRFLRDYPVSVPGTGMLNDLLDNVEFSDDDIEEAMLFAVDYYNAFTPTTNLTAASLPRVVVLWGTVSHLLRSEANRQRRNQISAQDGNVGPIDLDNKAATYEQSAQIAWDTFFKMARDIKTQRNMQDGYGGLNSGYRGVARRTFG
jgi:hypothetical protein